LGIYMGYEIVMKVRMDGICVDTRGLV
jgi:hypothetical protein